ncbi:SusD/RagB family nutrient-binding outer membrane lipoprotein [Sphingobacterium sp. DR205]|uniref:SusD/RagB family nutrient-binding outer membrane lipoprotein n=1 Tax=Sphingobacterium sp. DR205 TaxID=2713573 RepID=UPI0013E4B0CB|nr:SusD/RagB family nutrient-binding outer membrane lipoprotein [Sphingobacterium sp. DR205]QIH36657.1 SusD/RagB family nutrient-binding outer membrane lipoprotein [Sphingobacterium sp. DR205]
MKFSKIIVFIFLLCGSLQSCTKNFIETNTSPNDSEEAYPYQFMANALITAVSANMNRNRTFNNELMQVTVSIGDGDGKVFRYDFRRSWSDYLWSNHYTQISNFKEMYKQAVKPLTYNRSYQAIAMLGQVWLYSILTDTYGDIPYTESNMGADEPKILEPKFDKQEDIYKDLFLKLDSANNLFKNKTSTETIDPTHDPVFKADLTKWRKLNNSLFLRLLLRVSGKKGALQPYAINKIKEILVDNTADYPIMSSNDDSAIIKWTDQGAYVSPFKSTRAQDFRAVALCSFFLDYLRDTNDPRIDIPTYGTSGINRMGIAPVSGNYVGVPSGYAAGSEDYSKMSYFYSFDQNNGVNSLQTEPLTGVIMPFAEVQFIKAEAVLKGWIEGSIEDYFYSGVENNIKLWIPTWAVTAKEHLAKSDREWKDNATVAEKMEQIHFQKYQALFMVDMQQWYEYRRTGYPVLPKGKGLKNNGEMPARMYYPVIVQSANPTNYKLAVQQQGPDEINTKVWWQKP